MTSTFDLTDWYWAVNGLGPHRENENIPDPVISEVYSSARREYVSVNDTDYIAWKTAIGLSIGNPTADLTTQIATEDDLRVVLAPLGLAPKIWSDFLQEKKDAGIALTSTGTPALDATYSLDDQSANQVFQIGMYASQFGTFPDGGVTTLYPDMTGTPHTFSVDQFVNFLKVVAPMVYNLTAQAGVMRSGGIPTWPSQAATID